MILPIVHHCTSAGTFTRLFDWCREKLRSQEPIQTVANSRSQFVEFLQQDSCSHVDIKVIRISSSGLFQLVYVHAWVVTRANRHVSFTCDQGFPLPRHSPVCEHWAVELHAKILAQELWHDGISSNVHGEYGHLITTVPS